MGPLLRFGSLVGSLVLLFACAHSVPQDKATGNDGKSKGARTLELENGEVRTSGIVTYPGGDRVDWRAIELPAKARGTLNVRLTWTPPRPGLQLAVDVYDEYGKRLKGSKKSSRKTRSRARSVRVPNVSGKAYLRVYAVNRGDAGKYRLRVEFVEDVAGPILDWTKVELPDPPKLAAVPEPEVPCDEFTFDAKNSACRTVCPAQNAPPNWPACAGRCTVNPPDPNIPACAATMPCPNPPDRRVRSCPKAKWPKCADPANPDPENPNCDNVTVPPVHARIVKKVVQGSELIITMGAGSDSGIAKGWRATVLRGSSSPESLKAMPGGDVTIIRVDKSVTVGKIRLTADQIQTNPYVRLQAP